MKRKFSLTALIIIAVFSLLLGIGLTVRWDWVCPTRAQKQEAIFDGNTPRSFSDLAKQVQSSVVNISTSKNLRLRRGYYYEFHENYVQKYPDTPVRRQNSLGSGFIINKEGYILTNNHVIKGADEIQVKLSDGRSFKAAVVGIDPQSDIAVIKIDSHESLPTAQLGDSDGLQVGDWVVAIGNPFGLTQTVTAGILSAKGRVIGAGPYDDFLQTDASINPGNSGGPLFNLQGQVIGVNTAIVQGGQGIGFAIPINNAKTIIPQLIQSGKVQRGYLGIGLQEVSPELAKSLGMDRAEGVLVGVVYQGTPADRSGIKAGDIITKFNGKTIGREQDLPLFVSQTPVGSDAQVEVFRDGKYQTFTVKLASL